MSFGNALRLGTEPLRRVGRQPALFVRALVAVWIAVPVLTILVIAALDVRGLPAITLLLMAVCPGLPLVLFSTRSVGGAVSAAFGALLLTAATEPLLLPLWTRILTRALPLDLVIAPRHVLAVLGPTVMLPVALGLAIHRISLRAATSLARLSDLVFVAGMTVAAVAVVIKGTPLLVTIPRSAFVAVVLMTLADTAIGYAAGWPSPEDQKAIALATALGNPALALAVIEVSYPGYRAGAMVAVYLVIRALTLTPFQWWLKRMRRRHARHEAHA